MQPQRRELMDELNAAMNSASAEWYALVLRQLIDLFVGRAHDYGADHIEIYDEVMLALIEAAPESSLAEVSSRLAAVDNAPPKVAGYLAQHASITVAGPQLEKSNVVSPLVLVEIAKSASPAHLAAIARRATIDHEVTDAMIERGDYDTIVSVIENSGASFSDIGFSKLISKATRDGRLSALIAARKDVPEELRSFLSLASDR